MKLLTIIVHAEVQRDIAALLRGMKEVSGFTFMQVEGHGHEVERDGYLAAREQTVGYVARMRADVLLDDAHVDAVLARLAEKEARLAGQGVYWVTTVDTGGRFQ